MYKTLAKAKNSLSLSHPKIRSLKSKFSFSPAFTIVELLIVIVIIGILATIVIVAYNGITTKARQVTLQSDLSNSRTKMEIANATDGHYPAAATVNANPNDYIAASKGNTLTYHTNSTQDTYCISAIGSDNIMYVISNLSGPYTGNCTGTSSEVATEGDGTPPPPPAPAIQTITTATCPTTMTRVQDARDNHTYWVQKLADGKCWMLTNLAYAGGGTNTYSDTKTLTNGTGGSNTYTVASYYVVPSTTSYTTEPTAPSTATDGTGQYGYLYNWCAAMGAQTGTDACLSAATPNSDLSISICPSGWRIPTGGTSGEFRTLSTAINASDNVSGSTTLRSVWLAQYSGRWISGFDSQGTNGFYWSSTEFSGTNVYDLNFSNGGVKSANYDFGDKYSAHAIRCLAAV